MNAAVLTEEDSGRRDFRAVLLAWAVTRASLLLVGWLSMQLLPSGAPHMGRNLRHHETAPAPIEMWARWDAEWYLLIAESGYAGSQQLLRQWPNYHAEDAAGFFPLYPALVRAAGGALGNPVLGGVVVSNLFLLLAAWLLTRLVRRDHGSEAARWAPWVLFAFPTTLFLSAVYSEAVFLALAIGSVYAARQRRWWLSGGLGFLAALTRPLGFLLVLPLGWEIYRGRGGRAWPAVALPPLGTALFLAFCQITYGDFLAPVTRQVRWRGAGSGPWRAFERFFENPEVHGAHNSGIDFVVAVAVLAAVPLMFRLLRPGDAAYGTVAALAPLCTSLWSYSRLSLAIFPLYLLLAIGCGRWRAFAPAYLAICLPVAALFMAMFANGWWVG